MDPTQGQGNELDDFLSNDATHDPDGDADFEAGFNSTSSGAGQPGAGNGSNLGNDAGNEDPAAAAAAAQAAADAEAAAAIQAEVDRLAAEANAPVTITKADLDAMRAQLAQLPALEQQLHQTRDSMAGRLGSLNQTIDALKAQASKGGIPAIKALSRLEKEFPELGSMLREDLAEAFGGGAAPAANAGQQEDRTQAGGQPASQEHVDPLNHPEVVKTLQKKEMSIVDVIHPGWRGKQNDDGTYTPGLIDSPEFKEWRAGLPPTAQQMLGNTWDSGVLKDALAHFKSWNTERTSRAQDTAAAQAAAAKQRDKRLANAAPATTGAPTGINAVDEDAAFASGFERARGGRG